MGYSLRGTTGAFPSVVSTCANYFSFLLQWITSLPTIILRTFSSLYYTFLTLRSGHLTLPVGKQVLHREVDENNDNDLPSDLLQLPPPYFHLIWIAQTEKLKHNTTGTLVFCHTSYHRLRGTNWPPPSAIEHLLLTAIAHAIYPQQVPQTDGQTNAGASINTRAHAASLKRKASSASVRKSRARRTNNRGNGDDENDGEDNLNPPNAPHNNQDDAKDAPEKHFACHFFKLNPREYHRCGSKQLKTLDNLKQHLKRSHYTARCLPCPRCWAEFPGDGAEAHQALRIHARGRCEQKQGPDTLYGEDLGLLNTERGATDHEKWYQIWGQICEGHQAPDSPYIELNGIDDFGGLIGREYRSRLLAHMPDLRTEFRHLVGPELTNHIVNRVEEVVQEVFPHSTLFETRHRRIFQPINTAQPTIEAQMDHEGQGDDVHDDDAHGDDAHGDDGSHGAPPVMEGQPMYQTYPLREGDLLEQGWQPESPSEILFGPNHAEQRNQPEVPQSFEELLGPPMF